MTSMADQSTDVAYERMSDDELNQILEQLGRNGPLSETQKKIQDTITDILAGRASSGVVQGEKMLHHPV